MSVKLLTEHHLEFLSLKGGCTGSSESPLVKIPHCWKSRVTALTFCKTCSVTFLNAKIIRQHGHLKKALSTCTKILCNDTHSLFDQSAFHANYGIDNDISYLRFLGTVQVF